MPDEYIVIVGWDKFQHYKNRRPAWIKNYTDLIRKDEYLDLNPRRRAILHGLWITYAANNGIMRRRTADLSSTLRMRVLDSDLEALNHAGFIGFAASKPLASRDRDRDIKNLGESNVKSIKPGHCPVCEIPVPKGSLADHMRNNHNVVVA